MATMEGSLSKWTNVMKGWQYRWFVLDDNAGLLSYYTVRYLCTNVSQLYVSDIQPYNAIINYDTASFSSR